MNDKLIVVLQDIQLYSSSAHDSQQSNIIPSSSVLDTRERNLLKIRKVYGLIFTHYEGIVLSERETIN